MSLLHLTLYLRKLLFQAWKVCSAAIVTFAGRPILAVITNERLWMLDILLIHSSHEVLASACSLFDKWLWCFCLLRLENLSLSWHVWIVHSFKHLLLHYDLWITTLILIDFIRRSKTYAVRINIFPTIHGQHLIKVPCIREIFVRLLLSFLSLNIVNLWLTVSMIHPSSWRIHLQWLLYLLIRRASSSSSDGSRWHQTTFLVRAVVAFIAMHLIASRLHFLSLLEIILHLENFLLVESILLFKLVF